MDDTPSPGRTAANHDAEGVHALVAVEYDLGRPDHCQLLSSGINDVFLIEIGAARYALRVQPLAKWWARGEDELRFELDLLDHLRSQQVPVSYPIPRRNGDPLGSTLTLGGSRFYTLFSWADGNPPRPISHDQVYIVGNTLAHIHAASDSYLTRSTRYRMDERTLLERSLRVLEPTLARGDPADAAFIRQEVARLSAILRAFDPGTRCWGIIHGDVQPLNYHFDANGRITFFDFDHCGFGWRIYDVAMYYTRIAEALRTPMLVGYQAVRHLNDAEIAMLADFGRVAWVKERTMVGEGMDPAALAERLRDPYLDLDE